MANKDTSGDHEPQASEACAQDDSPDDTSSEDSDDPVADLEPFLQQRLDLYQDSDHYRTLTSSSALGVTAQDYALGFGRNTVFASDLRGAEQTQDQVLSVSRDFSEQFGVGGGFGTAATTSWTDLVWSFRSHADFGSSSLEANVARDALEATAQEIRANIRQTDFGFTASDNLTTNLSSGIEFHHKLYSDGNSSNDLEFSPNYSFELANGKLALGYTFDYQGFTRGTNNGYWAPERLLSNEGLLAWTFDWIDTYGRLELTAGRAITRISTPTMGGPASGFDAGAKAVLGFRPARDTIIEYYWSGTGSSQWSSTSTGLGLTYAF